MGYRTPNIDRIANEGMTFTDYYGQQSCTAGRAAFITGQNPIRTGLTKVGMPGADVGIRAEDPTIAELLKPLGCDGPVRQESFGDKDEFLPTVHGFDEFFGNLYHLNVEASAHLLTITPTAHWLEYLDIAGKGPQFEEQTKYVVKDLEIGQPINSAECSETADGVARESKGVKSCPRAGCGRSACPVR